MLGRRVSEERFRSSINDCWEFREKKREKSERREDGKKRDFRAAAWSRKRATRIGKLLQMMPALISAALGGK